jgi:hypothetical protein
MHFTTIISEGNLIPADLLAQVAEGRAEGQQPADFGLDKSRRLGDEIAAAWADVRAFYAAFQRSLRRLAPDDPATTVTRERWVLPLLEVLGYTLTYQPAAALVGGRSYAISHRAGSDDNAPPVHIEGLRRELDKRGPAGRPRLSPHGLVQEYLNSTEHLWGIVTNGERLRLLRDSSRTVRPVFVEFDLRSMLEGEKFSEFALFYRLLHRTRLPQTTDDGPRCLLERYHQQAIEAGGRVRDGLRDGVELALRGLGNGLLRHQASSALRAKLAANEITQLGYYRQLLRLVYRLLFLMVAEERQLIGTAAGRDEAGLQLYQQYYSVSRLRRLAEQRGSFNERHSDLWQGLLATFRLLEDDEAAQLLGIAALDGDLFGPQAMPDLAGASIDNGSLLQAIRALSLYRDPQSRELRRVNYAALDVEELGSVYESLLDYRPVVRLHHEDTKAQSAERTEGSEALRLRAFVVSFDLVSGTERKTTGSYYTRPELVQELIKSALEPVIADRLAETNHKDTKAQSAENRETSCLGAFVVNSPEEALLSIRVVDPACGSGHFLLAAARRLARELARIRAGEEQPAPAEYRRALRDVIARCIYGVDLNPLAVDLCKVALWLESLEPGKPLSFLDSKIRWGNSLVGATRALVEQGIPDEAYKPVTGDDKAVAAAFRKRNKKEREARQSGQLSMELDIAAPTTSAAPAAAARALNAMPNDSVAAVRAQARRYEELRAGLYNDMVRFHLWTAAFFSPLRETGDVAVPTSAALHEWNERPSQYNLAIKQAFEIASAVGFFHWELEFPEVFALPSPGGRGAGGEGSGFDVVLGNPPWERIKLQEQEHFADTPEIRDAPNKAAREKMIAAWRGGTPAQQARIAEFEAAKYRAEAESRFVRASERFPLTAVGDVNTYALFAEQCRNLIAPAGRAGIIVPTGVATDDSTKAYFGDLATTKRLVSLYDFENREAIFPGVHRSYKFSLLTLGATSKPTRFLFFATNVEQLADDQRAFALSAEEIELINPNTRTAPVFRTSADAELTKKIYRRVPVLVREGEPQRHEGTKPNPWGISFMRMFDMSNDSGLFKNEPGEELLPLYEGRMGFLFDHRFATFDRRVGDYIANENRVPQFSNSTEYFAPADEVERRLKTRNWNKRWFFGVRRVTRNTDVRTLIGTYLPYQAVTYGLYLFFSSVSTQQYIALTAVINSLVLDYLCRNTTSQPSLTYGVLNQLPVLPPDRFTPADIAYIVPRVLELVYTAWDMQPFAEDIWAEADGALRELIMERRKANHKDTEAQSPEDIKTLSLRAFVVNTLPPPFIWHEARRARIRAELDARIAKLYGLSRDELRYILDPSDIYGPEFPGETFRVLKEKEIKQYGEYRTRRLVLEAWDKTD